MQGTFRACGCTSYTPGACTSLGTRLLFDCYSKREKRNKKDVALLWQHSIPPPPESVATINTLRIFTGVLLHHTIFVHGKSNVFICTKNTRSWRYSYTSTTTTKNGRALKKDENSGRVEKQRDLKITNSVLKKSGRKKQT